MRSAVERTLRELTRVAASLAQLRLWSAPSAANFVLLRLSSPAAPVFERLLRRGLIVRPLAGYGLPDCLRISIGLPQDNDRLLATLPQVL
jgi:histidinol-phosphate aminotransferase